MWTAPTTRRGAPLEEADLAEFKRLCGQSCDPSSFPLATAVEQRIPIYTSSDLLPLVRDSGPEREKVLEELHKALSSGPGVFVIQKMIAQDVIDQAERVTAEVRREESGFGSKASDRTFSYSQKHAIHDPESFAAYYGNEILALVCESWLGVGYQITAMTNAIIGSGDQGIHRDYHLSSQSEERLSRFPLISQISSQLLTLQCAIAHTDMPLLAGPTRFAPFTQQFQKGYTAFRRPEYREYVSSRMSQVPLERGDAVFFNPACFHQPGRNTLSHPRVANLLQVSACYGRPMETNDRVKMSKSVWPVIRRWAETIDAKAADRNGKVNGHPNGDSTKLSKLGNGDAHHSEPDHPLQLSALINATCDDYGYPNRKDADPSPQGTQADVVWRAIREKWSDEEVYGAIDAHDAWHRP